MGAPEATLAQVCGAGVAKADKWPGIDLQACVKVERGGWRLECGRRGCWKHPAAVHYCTAEIVETFDLCLVTCTEARPGAVEQRVPGEPARTAVLPLEHRSRQYGGCPDPPAAAGGAGAGVAHGGACVAAPAPAHNHRNHAGERNTPLLPCLRRAVLRWMAAWLTRLVPPTTSVAALPPTQRAAAGLHRAVNPASIDSSQLLPSDKPITKRYRVSQIMMMLPC